jgi:epoxyqueuosine reductase
VDSPQIKAKAYELGFELVGVAPLIPSREADFYAEWLERGYAGEMAYLERRVEERLDPQRLLPNARSVVVCAMNYNTDRPMTSMDPERAWVSRYAWGDDYHDSLKKRLHRLAGWIEESSSGVGTRVYVDTGPLLERVHAKYAGVGWFGKNTCIIDQKIGSWIFLGCILTELNLEYDTPAPDRCGSCTRCLEACPTGAILEPYVLDSRRCISYLTIEARGDIPGPLREGVGQHLFGCDLCQDVCPWNRRAPFALEKTFEARPELFWPAVDELLDLDEDGWRQLIRGTALKRARVSGLIRNLMVIAGNSGLKRLRKKVAAFLDHPEATVRSHAHWAVDQLDEIQE